MSNFDTLDETTSRNDNDFVVLRQGSSDYKQRRSVLEEGIRAFASNEANQALADAKSYADTQDAATLNSASNADNLSSGIVSTDVLPGATDPQSVDRTSDVKYVFTPAQLYNAANSLLRSDLNLNKRDIQLVTFNEPEDYAKPSGWCGFINSRSEYKPSELANHFYYKVISRRDLEGGYVGLAVDYVAGMIAVCLQRNSTLPPIWRYVWDDTNLPIPTEAQAEDSSSTTPYAWTPQRVAESAASAVNDASYVLTDYTGTKIPGQTYTNTTNRIIHVFVWMGISGDGTNALSIYLDNGSNPILDSHSHGGSSCSATFNVLPGQEYRVERSRGSGPLHWNEELIL